MKRLKCFLSKIIFIGIVFVVIPVLLTACREDRSASDVLLISIDTLRADHLGAYGYPNGYTPFLDYLARTGTVFRNVISAIPQTTPSHASLLTGLYPHHHRSRDNAMAIGKNVRTLPEILLENGYDTAGFTAHFLLAPERSGLQRGFKTYTYKDHQKKYDRQRKKGPFPLLTNEYSTAAEVNRNALKWIQSAQSPYFMFVHYYDCHKPYHPPAPYRNLTHLSQYDRELASVDGAIQDVVTALAARGLARNLVVHMLADHGESLGEHNYTGHGKYLYFPSVDIPWISRDLATDPDGRIFTETTSNIDLAPSVLAGLNISTADAMDGGDIRNFQKSGPRYAFSESGSNWNTEPKKRIYSVRDGSNALIIGLNSGNRELYNHVSDPGETRNRHSEDSPEALRLEKELRGWLKMDQSAVPDPKEVLDPETIQALQALGYMQE